MPYGFMPETQPDPHLLMRLLEQQRQQRKQGGLVSTQVDPATGEFVPMGRPPVMGMPIPQQRQPSALDRILGGVLGPQQSYGGLLSNDDLKTARQRALMTMGASLLSGSGPSPVKRGTGELIGNAMMTGMQAQDQAGQDMLQAMLLKTKLQQKQMPKAHVVNGALVDEAGRVIYSSPQTPKPMDPLSKLQADYDAGLITQDDFIARRKSIIQGRPPVSISIDQRAESKAEEAYGTAIGNAFADVLHQGRTAQDEKDILVTLRDNPATTGPTQNFRAAAGSLFADLGLPISESRLNQITDFGAYKSAASDLVLSKQMQQKGPQTDKDAVVIRDTVANAKNLPEVNRMIVGYGLALADRKIERAQFAEEYRQRSGKIEGWETEWRAYMRQTPLVGKNPNSGRIVFWNEYLDQMRAANPDATDEEIMTQWRRSYGSR